MSKELLEDLIYITSERSKIRGDIIEKDYYVCLILKELASKQKEYFAYFKGGTAVYKMLNVMKRFFEILEKDFDECNRRDDSFTRSKRNNGKCMCRRGACKLCED